ncbi:hypothetical protein HDV05_004417 [Chytridiales sp. JEL 0842]|nr:hypothetical protein HDV05_004417 [Chytridiales sp. JEL 0842]
MPHPILPPGDSTIHPFRVTRYVREGGRVDAAPRVESLEISRIDVGNLSFLPVEASGSVPGHRCELDDHDGCKGHLLGARVADVDYLVLPAWMLSVDSVTRDTRTVATERMLRGEITSEEYATTLLSALMGKRGAYRSGGMSLRPLTASRGVATLCWWLEPDQICVPFSWLHNIPVPTRDCNPTTGYLSPYFTFGNIETFNHGLIFRCPVNLMESMQAVRIIGWEHNSIGCHPSLCKKLHLDFDGDEVHFLSVGSQQAIEEVKHYLPETRRSLFSAQGIDDFRQRYNDLDDDDFMLQSTYSVSELETVSYDQYRSDYFKLCNVKESARAISQRIITDANYRADIIKRSSQRMLQVAESKFLVPKTYTLARQLRYEAAMEIVDGDNISFEWQMRSSGGEAQISIPASLTPYGLPAVRFAIKLTEVIIQRSLDLAKHKSTGGDISKLLRLVANRGDTLKAGLQSQVSTPIDSPRSSISSNRSRWSTGDLRIINDRHQIADISSTRDRLRMCLRVLQFFVDKYQIDVDASELISFAAMINASLSVSGGQEPLTDFNSKSFLKDSNSSYLSTAVLHHSKIIGQMAQSSLDRSRLKHDLRCPITCVVTGNFSALHSRSVAFNSGFNQ